MMEKAKKVIERLEGTLIADLKSIKISAEKRLKGVDTYKDLPGGLNFSLFLMGLIASETIGYFLTKGSDTGRSEQNIKGFISCPFFNCDSYKKDKYLDTLVSLRTNLAHIFGMTDFNLDSISDSLSLCVGSSNDHELLRDGNKVKLNGIKFVDCIIEAFDSIKAEVLELDFGHFEGMKSR
jgi:hypothetical protein